MSLSCDKFIRFLEIAAEWQSWLHAAVVLEFYLRQDHVICTAVLNICAAYALSDDVQLGPSLFK